MPSPHLQHQTLVRQIDTIPAEVLLRILKVACTFNPKFFHDNPATLVLVCKKWLSILTANPVALWSNITIVLNGIRVLNGPRVKFGIKQTSRTPTHITILNVHHITTLIHLPSRLTATSKLDLESIIPLIQPNAKTLSIQAPENIEHLFNSPWPHLVTVEMHCSLIQFHLTTTRLWQAQLWTSPQLHNVKLFNLTAKTLKPLLKLHNFPRNKACYLHNLSLPLLTRRHRSQPWRSPRLHLS